LEQATTFLEIRLKQQAGFEPESIC
jgi:hypothetical protein